MSCFTFCFQQPMVITRENVTMKLSQTAEAKKLLKHQRAILPAPAPVSIGMTLKLLNFRKSINMMTLIFV